MLSFGCLGFYNSRKQPWFLFFLFFLSYHRMEKCQVCYSHLLHIRQDLINCSPLLTQISSKLNLNDAFSLLDWMTILTIVMLRYLYNTFLFIVKQQAVHCGNISCRIWKSTCIIYARNQKLIILDNYYDYNSINQDFKVIGVMLISGNIPELLLGL